MLITKIQFLTFGILSVVSLVKTEPLSLTDKTWKDMLCGQWMVELYGILCTFYPDVYYSFLVMHHGAHHVNISNRPGVTLRKL